MGGRLLRLAEEQARARGLRQVRLYTNEAMTENLAYYLRRGYSETHRATQDGFRRIFFTKPLNLVAEPDLVQVEDPLPDTSGATGGLGGEPSVRRADAGAVSGTAAGIGCGRHDPWAMPCPRGPGPGSWQRR